MREEATRAEESDPDGIVSYSDRYGIDGSYNYGRSRGDHAAAACSSRQHVFRLMPTFRAMGRMLRPCFRSATTFATSSGSETS